MSLFHFVLVNRADFSTVSAGPWPGLQSQTGSLVFIPTLPINVISIAVYKRIKDS